LPNAFRNLTPAALALAACACSRSPAERYADLDRGDVPIVVVLIDTLRADRLGCYGYGRPTSPHLDAFAEEAVLFERCIAPSTWTRPSTASLFTGLLPSRHGATSAQVGLGGERWTIAEALRERGYRTAAFGSNPHVFRDTGFDQGFETFVEPPPESPRVPYARGEEIVDRALGWLEERRGGEPWFLYVHLFDPHAPYDPREPYRARFDRGERGQHDAWTMLQRDAEPEDLGAADRAHMVDLYDAEVAYADAQVGRLLAAIDLDATAVLVLADHGEELFDHGGWSHEPTMYDELLHVPLIASFPALRAAGARGERVGDLALLVDVLPTVLDLVGAEAREGLTGRSLLAKALGAGPATPFAISEADQFGQFRKSVRSAGAKVVRSWSPERGERIFDLAADPGETRSVAPSALPEAARLGGVLDEHLRGARGRYHVRFENRSGANAVLIGVLVSEIARVEGLELVDGELEHEGGADWDGSFATRDHTEDGRSFLGVEFTLRTLPGDRDGVAFESLADDHTLRLFVSLAGAPFDPAWIHLGAGGASPDAAEVGIVLSDPDLFAGAEPPPAAGDAPFALSIWRTDDASGGAVEMTAEDRAALEKLGYFGK
jgi:arylsulfatase A-like enzyme